MIKKLMWKVYPKAPLSSKDRKIVQEGINKINEVVEELNEALNTIKDMKPLIEYVRLQMHEEQLDRLSKQIKSGVDKPI